MVALIEQVQPQIELRLAISLAGFDQLRLLHDFRRVHPRTHDGASLVEEVDRLIGEDVGVDEAVSLLDHDLRVSSLKRTLWCFS